MIYSSLVLVTLVATLSHTYTITKDVLPTFPTEKLVNNTLVRLLPNGEEVIISCPDDTILNKETLTCDFVKVIENSTLVKEVLPSEDCRSFELCDSTRCSEMFCLPPLLFNKILGVCDYPDHANCCEFAAKNNSRILQNS